MRIILDTNVLVAAFATRGQCHELLEQCVQRHVLITSEFILTEFREKMIDKIKLHPTLVDAQTALLRSRMQVIEPAVLEETISRDPDDDVVIATAVTGACQCIITGDKDLLSLKEYRGIRLIMPAEFWAYEAAPSG